MFLYGITNKGELAQYYYQRCPDFKFNELPPYLCKILTEERLAPIGILDKWCGSQGITYPINTLEWEENKIFFYDRQASALLVNYVSVNPEHVTELSSEKVNLIQTSIKYMAYFFPSQTQIIFEFTSVIVWLKANECGFSGAAFHELPHCTFLSDAFFIAVTPSAILEPIHRPYIIFENLYHEALHHQLSASVMLHTKGYYEPENHNNRFYYIKSRNKSWSIPNILQAAYVYLNVLSTRISYLQIIIKHNLPCETIYTSITQAINYCREMINVLLQDDMLKQDIQDYISKMDAHLNLLTKEYKKL
ncbi:hypothetical protein PGO10_05710 [Klebsiella aerogenes]